MAEDKSNLKKLRGKSKLRAQAFMGERYAHFQKRTSEKGKKKRAKAIEKAETADPEDPNLDRDQIVRFKLQQLQEFRGRQAQEANEKALVRARKPIDLSKNNWIPIGPSVVRNGQAVGDPMVSGRVRGIAIAPDGKRIYVASANGGVWRSLDKGDSWVSLMDGFDEDPNPDSLTTPLTEDDRADSLACGAIALLPGASPDQDVVFVGTGEPLGGVAYTGVGPVVSTNGGKTWKVEPVSGASLLGYSFYALKINPAKNQEQMVVAATSNGLFRREPIAPNSDDYHWVQKWVKTYNDTSGKTHVHSCTDVVVCFDGTNTVFFAAESSGDVYRSPDGATWNPITRGSWPAGRISLAVHPANTDIVYALHQNGRIYRYDDSETPKAWKPLSIQHAGSATETLAGLGGSYNHAIVVDPNDVNTIFVGGSYIQLNEKAEIETDDKVPKPLGGAVIYRIKVGDSQPTLVEAEYDYIGASAHADVHALVIHAAFPNELWVGCDGGVFFAYNKKSDGLIFQPKNNGLQTMTMNWLGQHPRSEAVLYCGTQDNGGQRFTGEPAWLLSTAGDCGAMVVNWKDPFKILSTYIYQIIYYQEDGGANKKFFVDRSPPVGQEYVLFYAPFVGTPVPENIDEVSDETAATVAFGALSLWLSNDFGENWTALPRGAEVNQLVSAGGSTYRVGPVRSITFVSASKIYIGTFVGQVSADSGVPGTDRIWRKFTIPAVFRYVKQGDDWKVSNNLLKVSPPVEPATSVTSIAIDPSDPSGDSFYITLGGFNTSRHTHLWHCQFTPDASGVTGTSAWTAKSGPALPAPDGLLDVHHSAIVALKNPEAGKGNLLYVGADIGIWHAEDDGAAGSWTTYSEGLPDAAVVDLKYQPISKVLRAATHGRGVFERRINVEDTPDVELFIRSTQLDMGRGEAVEDLPDPTSAEGDIMVSHKKSPDIKIDAPNQAGIYRFLKQDRVDFAEFTHDLQDQSERVAFHERAIINNKVYVQVHNRGPKIADGARVMLLLTHVPEEAPPDLSPTYLKAIQEGRPLHNNKWISVGIQYVDNIRAGFPQIVSFNLTTDRFQHLLLDEDDLEDEKFGLMAVVHHPEDEYNFTESREVAEVALNERKAAYKEITLKKFTGMLPTDESNMPLTGFVRIPPTATVPGAPFDAFLGMAFRMNDDTLARSLGSTTVSPLIANGADANIVIGDGDKEVPFVPERLLSAIEITLNKEIELTPGLPLIWSAREKITINKKINALGKGAKSGEEGDFGGSGGGGSAAGQEGKACKTPVSKALMLEGGALKANGSPLSEAWATRATLLPAMAKGGASGGGPSSGLSGGAGGGVVFLCAPVIEFDDENLDVAIDASGAVGGAGTKSGGGGGGLVILIARKFKGLEAVKIKAEGGKGDDTGGDGGDGFVLKREIGY